MRSKLARDWNDASAVTRSVPKNRIVIFRNEAIAESWKARWHKKFRPNEINNLPENTFLA